MDKTKAKIHCPSCKESFSEPSILELHLKKYKTCLFAQKKEDKPKEKQNTTTGNDGSLKVEETNCKGCNKPFKLLFSHISRTEKCREIYGEEFERMKSQKMTSADGSKAWRMKQKQDQTNFDKKEAERKCDDRY